MVSLVRLCEMEAGVVGEVCHDPEAVALKDRRALLISVGDAREEVGSAKLLEREVGQRRQCDVRQPTSARVGGEPDPSPYLGGSTGTNAVPPTMVAASQMANARTGPSSANCWA